MLMHGSVLMKNGCRKWLLGLLVAQSMSSVILEQYAQLIKVLHSYRAFGGVIHRLGSQNKRVNNYKFGGKKNPHKLNKVEKSNVFYVYLRTKISFHFNQFRFRTRVDTLLMLDQNVQYMTVMLRLIALQKRMFKMAS
jgi:hypothetical protein